MASQNIVILWIQPRMPFAQFEAFLMLLRDVVFACQETRIFKIVIFFIQSTFNFCQLKHFQNEAQLYFDRESSSLKVVFGSIKICQYWQTKALAINWLSLKITWIMWLLVDVGLVCHHNYPMTKYLESSKRALDCFIQLLKN